ncbi:MAG TPA: NMD3-related protein [Methanotrichaceae archaeon]|nr:NMD3-related protein [Methanotrichaceae archaeon]
MKSVCPKCGGPSEMGLCDRCSLESIKPLSCPDKVEVTVCSVCGARLVRGKWQITEKTPEEQAYEAVQSAVAVHKDLENPVADVRLMPRGATRYLANVTLHGNFRSLQVEDSCQIPVKVIRMACDRCSRKAGKYFEATIQVRGPGRAPTDLELSEAVNMALSMVDACYRRGDQLAFIQDVEEVKGGVDIVFGSTQLARQVARAIYERFGGSILETTKLVGMKDGNDLYRSTILVRMPRLKKGDFMKFKGSIYEVTGFDGKNILLTSIDGRKSAVSEEDAQDIEVLGNRSQAKKTVVISKDEKVVEIMDPETFKMAFAPRPRDLDTNPGDEVRVVKIGDGFLILD